MLMYLASVAASANPGLSALCPDTSEVAKGEKNLRIIMSEPFVFPQIMFCAVSPQWEADVLHDGLERED